MSSKRVGWVGGGTARDLFPILKTDGIRPQYAFEPFFVRDLIDDTGESTGLPFELDNLQMMGWFARVKEWRCQVYVSAGTITLALDCTYKFKTVSLSPLLNNGIVQLSELGNVRFRGQQAWEIYNGSQVASSPALPTWLASLTINKWQVSGDSDAVDVGLTHVTAGLNSGPEWEEDIFYPYFGISGSLRTHPSFIPNFSTGSVPDDYVYVGNCYVASPGGTFNTGIYAAPAPDPPPTIHTIDSVSVTINPTKYWPCRNSLGQQVYDENTGAQLADPFS